ncbi:unnamed protein product, partial [Symbiodinium pilosum]
DIANFQQFYSVIMANEDWQVLYNCASQSSTPRRYLLIDRGTFDLSADARNHLADSLDPIPADELFSMDGSKDETGRADADDTE